MKTPTQNQVLIGIIAVLLAISISAVTISLMKDSKPEPVPVIVDPVLVTQEAFDSLVLELKNTLLIETGTDEAGEPILTGINQIVAYLLSEDIKLKNESVE